MNERKGIMGKIIAISNHLPHPVTIFIIFSIIVGILSVIFSKMGVSVEIEAINRSTKQVELQTYSVKSLFDSDGIRWIFEEAVPNFIGFAPLGVVLFFSLFFNFLNEVGLFPSFLKKSMQKIKGKYMSLFIAFLGVNSSFAGDIGYVLVIPIAGILYKQLKRNPIAGILLGFSSTSAGFAACLVSIDALLGGLSTSAMSIVNPNYIVTPLANSIFMFFYTFFITFIIAYINDKDLMTLLFKSLDGFGAFIVLCFFSSIFISWFSYSQLGIIIAAKGGQFLSEIGLTRIPLMIVFILFCSFIGSMSSKYVLIAPIFLPMLYKMGVSPELSQLAYRLGDSATNIVSPLMSFFPLVLIYCNKYNKKFGFGDLLAYMMPHAIIILITSIVFFGIWLVFNLPIGFNTVNFF